MILNSGMEQQHLMELLVVEVEVLMVTVVTLNHGVITVVKEVNRVVLEMLVVVMLVQHHKLQVCQLNI